MLRKDLETVKLMMLLLLIILTQTIWSYQLALGEQTRLTKEQMICRACKKKEVSVLLIPCRHLCICTECEGFISVCPVSVLPVFENYWLAGLLIV